MICGGRKCSAPSSCLEASRCAPRSHLYLQWSHYLAVDRERRRGARQQLAIRARGWNMDTELVTCAPSSSTITVWIGVGKHSSPKRPELAMGRHERKWDRSRKRHRSL